MSQRTCARCTDCSMTDRELLAHTLDRLQEFGERLAKIEATVALLMTTAASRGDWRRSVVVAVVSVVGTWVVSHYR